MSDSPHQYIPLAQLLTVIPVIGKPLADLLQPVLTQIVNLGYDNPENNGWDVGQANVPTGFGIGPSFEQIMTAFKNLAPAVQQGASAAAQDLGAELSHPSSLLTGLSPDVASTSLLSGDPLGAVTSALSSIGSLALPAWQSALTFGLTIPSNLVNTFIDDIANPFNAVVQVANQAVAQTLAVVGIDAFVVLDTVNSALGDFGLPPIGL